MNSRWRSKNGIGSLIAGLFIILILMTFVASLILINRLQGRYSEVIMNNIDARIRELETKIVIVNVTLVDGEKLNITVSNLGSIDVIIRYIGVFNKQTRLGKYYNASEIGVDVKGVLINRFSLATNITTYEVLTTDLSTGQWIIQLISTDGVVIAVEYPI